MNEFYAEEAETFRLPLQIQPIVSAWIEGNLTGDDAVGLLLLESISPSRACAMRKALGITIKKDGKHI